MQVYRLPASLRPVRGFPALRLLRKLRPRSRPFPAVAASPVPSWADDPSSRVPILNLVSLGGELYPWRCRARVIESGSRAERLAAFTSEDIKAPPFLIAVPPVPSHHSEAIWSKYRGVCRPLRCLTMDTSVARPAIDGSHPVQFRPICLCHPIGDARSSFSAPFRPRSPLAGRHRSRRSRISKLERCFLTHSHLPRRRGALNTDQGNQFTSLEFTGVLKEAQITISMDGRGRCLDNIFIERLWRSLKYEAVYLHDLTDGFAAERVIGEWIAFYNTERPHSALDGATPAEIYWAGRPVDMMDKACALPTSPQAQQQQKAFSMNGVLAA